MIVGLTGPAQSGKDSFFSLAKSYFNLLNIKIKRLALADNLKMDMKSFLLEKLNIDILNISPDDKEKIRDLMVIYGKIKRQDTEGKYWTNLLEPQIKESLKENDIIFITDIRYAYYEEDEMNWIRAFKKNLLIHISRLDKNNILVPPRNFEENQNDPILKQNSDLRLCWHTTDDLNTRMEEASQILEKIHERYKSN